MNSHFTHYMSNAYANRASNEGQPSSQNPFKVPANRMIPQTEVESAFDYEKFDEMLDIPHRKTPSCENEANRRERLFGKPDSRNGMVAKIWEGDKPLSHPRTASLMKTLPSSPTLRSVGGTRALLNRIFEDSLSGACFVGLPDSGRHAPRRLWNGFEGPLLNILMQYWNLPLTEEQLARKLQADETAITEALQNLEELDNPTILIAKDGAGRWQLKKPEGMFDFQAFHQLLDLPFAQGDSDEANRWQALFTVDEPKNETKAYPFPQFRKRGGFMKADEPVSPIFESVKALQSQNQQAPTDRDSVAGFVGLSRSTQGKTRNHWNDLETPVLQVLQQNRGNPLTATQLADIFQTDEALIDEALRNMQDIAKYLGEMKLSPFKDCKGGWQIE